jgi:hypothetical protein
MILIYNKIIEIKRYSNIYPNTVDFEYKHKEQYLITSFVYE